MIEDNFKKTNLKGYTGVACRVKIASGGSVILLAANLCDLAEAFKEMTGKEINAVNTEKMIGITGDGKFQ